MKTGQINAQSNLMMGAVRELRTITNTLMVRHIENIAQEYPKAIERLTNAIQIAQSITSQSPAIQVAIAKIIRDLESALTLSDGESMFYHVSGILEDMENTSIGLLYE